MHTNQPGKVAIVTGAARRIGASVTQRLHSAGYNVLVHYRSSSAAATQLVESLNGIRPQSATGLQAELCDAGSDTLLIDAAVKRWGRLDLLVNNASEFYPTPVGKITPHDLEKLFTTNVYAPLLLAQAGLKHLQKHSGSVVNIIDIYAGVAHPNHTVYCASKAALAMLTKSLAKEFAPSVRVNGVSPGAILWPDGEATLSDAKKNAVLEKIPLARVGNAEDIADAVKYLAGAKYVTGHILTIDGGRTL